MPVYQTAVLEITKVDPNQTGTKDIVNEALEQISEVSGKLLEIDLSVESSPYTIPYSPTEGETKVGIHFRILRLSGATGTPFEVVVPDLSHEFLIHNNTNDDVEVRTSAGTGPTVPTTDIIHAFCDGTDVIQVPINNLATTFFTAVVEKTAAYTPALTDVGKWFEMNGGAADNDVTILPDGAGGGQVDWASVGNVEMHFAQKSVNQVEFIQGAGVTITPSGTTVRKLEGQNAIGTLKRVGANAWRLFGLLEA